MSNVIITRVPSTKLLQSSALHNPSSNTQEPGNRAAGQFQSPPCQSPADAMLPDTNIQVALACVNNIMDALEFFCVSLIFRRSVLIRGSTTDPRCDPVGRHEEKRKYWADKDLIGVTQHRLRQRAGSAAIGQLDPYLWPSKQIASLHSTLSGTALQSSSPASDEEKPLDWRDPYQ